ncbi:MAG: hypothetical protein GX633_07600 [Clostridiales bacterium]|nr:hypothetical protein [Clostridiales bacterium]
MEDVFLEHIVKKQPTAKDSLIKIGIILAAIVLIYIMLTLSAQFQFLSVIMPAVFVGLCFGGYKLITAQNYEFEYIVTNGELDIDKIIAKRSRKRILNVKPNEFELLAPYNNENKSEYERGTFAKTIDATSSKYAQNIWFGIATTKKDGRVRFLFEPTEKMVENMRVFMPRKVKLK